MQVFALLQIAALQVLARPQTPVVKPLRLIFKRGGAATKTSRGIALPGGLRGQGFRAYEKRHLAALVATFAPKFSHLPEELVGVVMMFYAHVGFY